MASQEVLTALEQLHTELAKLEPAIKHVETAQQVTQMVKTIPQKHLDLLKVLKEDNTKHKDELQELFSKEIQLIAEENRKLAKTTAEIQQQVKYQQTYLAQLGESAKELFKKIEDVHFPERLDKLDANVAGIMAAIQSVQSRLDRVERNITDRLTDLAAYQKEILTTLQSTIDKAKTALQTDIEVAAKKQQMLTNITWGLIVIAVVALFMLKPYWHK